ncbi:GNAT family N-acetyltransferase [Pseudoxanthomonas sp. SGD-10]|uniref:aminoglycoside 6'-N-acetyltransferase n=1 Tax=Pseudoxanthomonas sp. GW2 TaxID=1211114 RepID=UPI00031F8CB9|nr:aminoglycoside 6'-N-acetyltransferase [Pseudoxanthomonas sp. GW2]RRN80682.1 GNAT family N-acetyltransferase [Pseudoxanthomonas sp. SGD-10]
MNLQLRVRPPRKADLPAWAGMRAALWPEVDPELLASEASDLLHAADGGMFVAEVGGELVGLAEASLRHDYVNGTTSSPVGFLEAWYVAPGWRGRGVGRALLRAVEGWTRALGCTELASDALLDNTASHAAHRACGFVETERVVYFRKRVG